MELRHVSQSETETLPKGMIYNIRCTGLTIHEQEERVTKHIHLQNRFLHAHRMQAECLAANDIVLCLFLDCIRKVFSQSRFLDALAETSLIAANLSDNLINRSIQRVILICRTLLRTINHAARFDRQLQNNQTALFSQRDLCFCLVFKEFVKFLVQFFLSEPEQPFHPHGLQLTKESDYAILHISV